MVIAPLLPRLCALFVLCSVPANAAEGLPRELNPLRESLQKTRRMTARFKQTRHWSALQDALVTQGSIRYEKGGQLVWRTDPPAESEVIVDDQRATIHYPALGTTQTLDFSAEPGLGKVFQTIRAVMEADLESLQPLFQLRLDRKVPLSLTLTPRSPEVSRTVKRIHMEFDKALHLTSVRLDEPSGDWTEIAFHDHVIETATR
jgi:outer membrane lipoprotein-sorting protein